MVWKLTNGLQVRHYGFTDEELDFITNYDIKYRMGRNSGGDEESEQRTSAGSVLQAIFAGHALKKASILS